MGRTILKIEKGKLLSHSDPETTDCHSSTLNSKHEGALEDLSLAEYFKFALDLNVDAKDLVHEIRGETPKYLFWDEAND